MIERTDDRTAQFEEADIAENRTAAAFAYLGVLVFVPLTAAKGSRFARFHANQGLALLAVWVAYGIAVEIVSNAFLGISWGLYQMFQMVRLSGLVFPALVLIGIRNAVSGRAKELPLIGKLRLLR